MKAIILAIATALLLPGGAGALGDSTESGTLKYIQETGKLWGVKEVRANADGSVTLFDARYSVKGHGLSMRDADHNPVDTITLKQQAACSLSDGHHVFLEYRFLRAEDDALLFRVTERIDARSFGGKESETTGIVTVSAYADEDRQSP